KAQTLLSLCSTVVEKNEAPQILVQEKNDSPAALSSPSFSKEVLDEGLDLADKEEERRRQLLIKNKQANAKSTFYTTGASCSKKYPRLQQQSAVLQPEAAVQPREKLKYRKLKQAPLSPNGWEIYVPETQQSASRPGPQPHRTPFENEQIGGSSSSTARRQKTSSPSVYLPSTGGLLAPLESEHLKRLLEHGLTPFQEPDLISNIAELAKSILLKRKEVLSIKKGALSREFGCGLLSPLDRKELFDTYMRLAADFHRVLSTRMNSEFFEGALPIPGPLRLRYRNRNDAGFRLRSSLAEKVVDKCAEILTELLGQNTMEDFLGYALLHGMNAAGKLSARNSKGSKNKEPKPEVPKFFDYYYCHAAWMLGGTPFRRTRREQQGTAAGKRTLSTGGSFFAAQMLKFRSYGENVWNDDCKNRAPNLVWQYWKDQMAIPRNHLSRQDRYLLSKDMQHHQGGESRGERISKDTADLVKKICQDPNEPDASDEDIDVGGAQLLIMPKREHVGEQDEEELERRRNFEETRAEQEAKAIALLCELDSREFFNGSLSRLLQQLLFSLRCFKGVVSELLAVDSTTAMPQTGHGCTSSSSRQIHNLITTIEMIPPLATMLEHARREYTERIRNGASPPLAGVVTMWSPPAASGVFISPDLAAVSRTTLLAHAQQKNPSMHGINYMHGQDGRNFVSLPPYSSELQSPSINALAAGNPSSTCTQENDVLLLQPQQHLLLPQNRGHGVRTAVGGMSSSSALVAEHSASLLADTSGMLINYDPNARKRRAEARKSARNSTGSNPNVLHMPAEMFSPPAEKRIGSSGAVAPVPKARGRPKAKAAQAKKQPSAKGKSKDLAVRKSTAPKS
ncbi:unnamed protein product, partial [Amoebophrya sp. A25]